MRLPTRVPVDDGTTLASTQDAAAEEAALAALYGDDDVPEDEPDRAPAPRPRLHRVARRRIQPGGSSG